VQALILEAVKEMPAGAESLGQLRELDIVHQAQAENGLAFQLGTRSARRQGDDFPRPQRREQPFDDVAPGMSLAIDFAGLVDLVAAGGDDLGFKGQIAGGKTDTIELQLQISLPQKWPGSLADSR
jgi:hypothetical protein